MQNVRDIALWFLSRDTMSPKKLHKLCYYAQAWYCALYDGSPLFDDRIEAWIHGPVIPNLYPAYKDYRWRPIPKQEFDSSVFDQQVLDILETVYNTYGEFSGYQLENLTLSEEPWMQARGDLKPWQPGTAAIPHALMRDYYFRIYEQAQND